LANHLSLPPDRTLVIAEIGVNHDGSLSRALELVDHAAACGADAVKLQIFHARTLMHASAAFATYQKERCPDADPAAMLRRYELSADDIHRVVDSIRQHHLLPLATPFSLADVDAIDQLNLPAIKIASPDLVNLPLLKRAASGNKPLLVSTGAATLEEIATTVNWLRAWRTPLALLHCVSSYPTPAEQANLCWISELSRQFAVPVGFSDHTTVELAGALAVAAGATLVEKHLTYDRTAAGPDHAASADPRQFARYVSAIRLTEQLRGAAGKRVLPVEEDVRRVSRQSLVLVANVDAGRPLAETDLTTQRPGTGIPAAALAQVIGRCSRHSLPAGTMLQWDMLA
jgi:N-acetylneuraminate synthase/N,N'-diacetyllegionaminate synthase